MAEKKDNMRYKDGKSLATLWIAGTIAVASLLPDGLVGHVRDAYEHFRDSTQAVSEIVRGTKGERGVKNLEDALSVIREQTGQYASIDEELAGYLTEREELTGRLSKLYEDNETIAREAKRLSVNLQGFLKNFYEIGNDLKPGFWKKYVDDTIIGLYGMDKVEALEKSEKLKRFYNEVKEFYSAREVSENSIAAFSKFLSETETSSREQNERVNGILGKLEGTLGETYTTEDKLFDENPEGFWKGETDISGLERSIDQYQGNVDSAKSDVEEFTPVNERSGFDWITFMLNPMTLGFVGASALKGASKILPGILERPLNTGLAYPAHYTFKGLGKVGMLGLDAGKTITNRTYDGFVKLKDKWNNLKIRRRRD
ncbi:hypothetical protein AUJ84_02655 [Candidatus Pacearchaeota archaeon CG1_02_32_132]|nr:MAG: hypothetical protein AUJ84_02655 [Candidatus Pacearchaeota archaeon CG1_02_32_132]